MLLKRFKISSAIIFLVVCCVIQIETAASYKSEVEITPAPPEEETTKKTGFFGGVKNWFRGSPSTTPLPVLEATTQKTPNTLAGPNTGVYGQTSSGAQRPPPLVISGPPELAPLGPRVETPSTSPWGGNPKQPPQFPQPNTQGQQVSGGSSTSHQQPPQWPQQQPQGQQVGGGSSNSQQQPHPQGQQVGGGSSNSQQQPPQWPQSQQVGGGSSNPGGVQTPNSPHIPVGSTSTVKPSQPQTPQNVQNSLPRPGTGQPNYPTSQTSHTNQNNLPRPSGGQPNFPPGFAPYQPPKTQPSGFDLSYGGGYGPAPGSRPSQPTGGRPGFGTSPAGTSTGPTSSTTTTTTKPQQIDFDIRAGGDPKKPGTPTNVKEDFPALPGPRRPSTGGVKDDFPVLPTPKSPVPSPSSPVSPSSPSAWSKPLPIPASIAPTATTTTAKPPTHNLPAAPTGAGGNGVSFVPHRGPTTTVRPGFQSTSDSNSLATDVEIQTLTENLYTKEVNSQLNLITINAQGKTRSIDSADEAPQPLLDVNAKAFENPTVAKMRSLFNNYEQDTLTNEHVTPNERKEENDFVDAVMATNVMRQAMLFLQNKGIVGPDPKTHRDLVKELWFTQYSRGSGKIGSSGFEHVFVNEVKNGTIIGLHNWVYFFDEEKAGRLDYKGYLNQLDLGTKAKVLKVRFTHNGLNKPVNSLFIGTSPELELALYTVCFKLRPDRTCPVSLGNSKFGVVTYSWRYRGKSLIGSAYPEI